MRVVRVIVAALGCAAIVASGAAAAKPPYYLSSNPPTGPAKKGIVLTVHGGGWEGNYGSDADILMSAYIESFQGWGYRVFNLAHRPNRKSLKDMLDAVHRVKDSYPKRRLCLFGGSSGGHLALMAAIREPELVDCVIDQGGIADLLRPDTAPGWLGIRNKAAQIWGEKGLRAVSPYQHARKIEAPVLVIAPACDALTSVARQQESSMRSIARSCSCSRRRRPGRVSTPATARSPTTRSSPSSTQCGRSSTSTRARPAPGGPGVGYGGVAEATNPRMAGLRRRSSRRISGARVRLLHPEVDFRALTPSRFWEATSPGAVVTEILPEWLEPGQVESSMPSRRSRGRPRDGSAIGSRSRTRTGGSSSSSRPTSRSATARSTGSASSVG